MYLQRLLYDGCPSKKHLCSHTLSALGPHTHFLIAQRKNPFATLCLSFVDWCCDSNKCEFRAQSVLGSYRIFLLIELHSFHCESIWSKTCTTAVSSLPQPFGNKTLLILKHTRLCSKLCRHGSLWQIMCTLNAETSAKTFHWKPARAIFL